MNIGEAAAASGVSAKMIRHYEETGLIPKAGRTDAGYRVYGEREVHLLRFIRQARQLGFAMKQIGDLIGLWLDQSRSSRKVKQLAETHIGELDQRIRELQAMKSTLEKLAHDCHGDNRPDCPILDALGSEHGCCVDVPKAAA
ncbi:Cu(I)-responsive transcriptional regulator [Herbaspirillum sp. LeCh32-8]|uniref:Cu(I)-responsive transcriptional regulator n=1 Tax=Herbaspirillum sp. LeCh32-8 TaxID=2821356 RepID=UPI001AE8A870|nr:Cu(I)-responsive transcriptional regulator [Herbaspirillum sp. LeCh32-8]MBP0600207.1 Cu(I)-responsive transcriptional regulator [Herbaspirillum sp. LeCh32-8]